MTSALPTSSATICRPGQRESCQQSSQPLHECRKTGQQGRGIQCQAWHADCGCCEMLPLNTTPDWCQQQHLPFYSCPCCKHNMLVLPHPVVAAKSRTHRINPPSSTTASSPTCTSATQHPRAWAATLLHRTYGSTAQLTLLSARRCPCCLHQSPTHPPCHSFLQGKGSHEQGVRPVYCSQPHRLVKG